MKCLRHRLSMFMMFTAVFALTISGTQNAMADPGVGTTIIPAVPVVGGTALVGPAGTPNEGYDRTLVRMYSPMDLADEGLIVPSTPFAGPCGMKDHPEATGDFWDLFVTDIDLGTGGNQPGPAKLDLSNNGVGTTRFGNGGLAEEFFTATVIDPSQSGPLYWHSNTGEGAIDNTIGEADANDAIAEFVPPPPDGDRAFFLAVCADERIGSLAGPTNGFTKQVSKIFTQKPVAGEFLPIDTTALLIAGAQQSGIWMLSILAVAGVLLGLLRFQKFTKSN